MRKHNGIVMMPNQDHHEYLTGVFQQRDELEHIGESFTEAYILDLILEGLRDEYEPTRFAVKRDPEISLKEIETTVRHMYAHPITRVAARCFCTGRGAGQLWCRLRASRRGLNISVRLATK